MKRTSERFTTIVHRVQMKSMRDDFYLVPFSDIHWGNKNLAVNAWNKFKKWGQDTPNAIFIGNGDYLERFRAHTRSELQAIARKDGEARATLDEDALQKLSEFAKEIDFMQGRLVGLGDGNHAWEFADGRNDTQVLADMMGVPYLGVCAIVHFAVELPKYKRRSAFQYMQHHGVGGGGKTTGAQFNNIQDMANWTEGVSIFVMGDNHGLGAPPDVRLSFERDKRNNDLKVKDRQLFYIRSGGFTRYYNPGKSGYIVGKASKPKPVGYTRIRVYLGRSRKGGKETNTVHFEATTISG